MIGRSGLGATLSPDLLKCDRGTEVPRNIVGRVCDPTKRRQGLSIGTGVPINNFEVRKP